MDDTNSKGADPCGEPVLRIDSLCQSYGSHQVLKNLSLELRGGEILGVIGENGAGKSTLVKCILGIVSPSSGTIRLKRQATAIHQNLNLADDLPVWANFFLGREIRGRFGLLDIPTMKRRTREGLARLSADIDPSAETRGLSVSEKQMVEIARALDVNAEILILDEPSALLGAAETERLFGIMRSLKSAGRSMIYISHKLGEIKAVCDRVAVLRDGELAGAGRADELSEREMAGMMVGRPIEDTYPRVAPATGDAVFELESPSLGSLSVKAGEIVGIAGLAGSGQIELAETIAGFRRLRDGAMRIRGTEAAFGGPRDAQAAGVGFLSPDRDASGVWREFAVFENVALGALDAFRRNGLVSRQAARGAAAGFACDFKIRCEGVDDEVSTLSGGNAQKVAIAKVMANRPSVVVLCEPTQGVDVGARHDIYALLARMAGDGMAAVLVSSDMAELIGMCSRIAVMREGRIAGEVSGEDMTERGIIYLATGAGKGRTE